MKLMTQLLSVLAVLQLSTNVMAEESLGGKDLNVHMKGFIGQRPYAAPVQPKAERADQAWEGATLRVDPTSPNGQSGLQQLRLHQLSKRPF